MWIAVLFLWVWGKRGTVGQRLESRVVCIGQLHAPGLPIRHGLCDPVPRRGNEVPVDVTIAQELSAKDQHRRTIDGPQARRMRTQHQHLSGAVREVPQCHRPGGDVHGALGMAAGQLQPRSRAG